VTVVPNIVEGYDAEVDLAGFAVVRRSDGTHAYDGGIAELTALSLRRRDLMRPVHSHADDGCVRAVDWDYETARHAVLLWWSEGGGALVAP
jgi:hypothetical protein